MDQKLMTRQIEFELTNHCNAHCIFCPRSDPRTKGFIKLETIQQGVALAKAVGLKGFKISGFGEPTLHPDLVKHLTYIRQEIPDAFIMMITNGSLLKPELFEALAGIPINRINISFNGYDKQSYEAQMVGLDFETVLANLKYIGAQNRGRIELQFVPIISKRFGKAEVEKMKVFLKEYGFNDGNFRFHFTMSSRSGKIENEELIDREFVATAGRIKIEDPGQVICVAHLNNLYIDWQGDLHICCDDIHGEAIIGRISELRTVEDLKKLEAANFTARINRSYEVCRKCSVPLTHGHQVIDGKVYTNF
jgi:radical SAM protein with 4Fe4S-binding SPASM domain